jgi:phosphate transport system substrate-binding protein
MVRGALRSRCIAVLSVVTCITPGALAFAQARFDPHPIEAGTLRIWGDTYMAAVVRAWEERFRQYHPDVQFETKLMGTDTAMPGIYNNVADIALLGRESNQTENDGFLHTLQYRPLQLRLMTGSLDSPGMSYAPVLFVNKDNPLQKLTLAQADAVLGCGPPGESAPAKTWGDLGVGGEWKDKPIHLYTFDTESGSGLFVQHKLQGKSRKMNWEVIREFPDVRHTDGTAYEAGEQTMDALLRDPYGLAVSSLRYANPDVKAVALAAASGSPYVRASRKTLIDGTYPLTRITYAFVNQPPSQPVPTLVKEFLRFVYSDEGQALIEVSRGFLLLAKEDAAKQVLLLNESQTPATGSQRR